MRMKRMLAIAWLVIVIAAIIELIHRHNAWLFPAIVLGAIAISTITFWAIDTVMRK